MRNGPSPTPLPRRWEEGVWWKLKDFIEKVFLLLFLQKKKNLP